MAGDEVVQADAREGPITTPWPLVGAGVGCTALAALLGYAGLLAGFRPALIGLGVLLAGGGIAVRPRSLVILAAALAPYLGAVALPADWDSIAMLLGIMTTVAVVAAAILLLPTTGRKVVVSLLMLVHFGGILTAITSAPPPNSPGNWVVNTVWAKFYRPYLQFVYLNNAYHFYSPEPGPAGLLWARVEYEDHSSKRLTLVDRDLFPNRLQYQRRLAIISQIENGMPAGENFLRLVSERKAAGEWQKPQIPMHRDLPEMTQYREPNHFAKQILCSIARHIAVTTPHPDGKAITGVKLYQVTHRILNAPELAAGFDPNDPTTFLVYYAGDYTADGELKRGHYDDKGELKDACYRDEFAKGTGKDPNAPRPGTYQLVYQDPFLWWMIPIQRELSSFSAQPGQQGAGLQSPLTAAPQPLSQVIAAQKTRITNYVKIHAGDQDEGGSPW